MNKRVKDNISLAFMSFGLPGCILFYMRHTDDGHTFSWYFLVYIISFLLLMIGLDIRYKHD